MDINAYNALGRILAYLVEQSDLPRYISTDFDTLVRWMGSINDSDIIRD